MSDFYVSDYLARRSAGGTLVTSERTAELDLEACIGQRRATFEFNLINGVTGENLGRLYPIDDQPATITHDTSRTIKRSLQLLLDSSDASEINVLTDRILPSMILAGREWPLGRFMFTSRVDVISTGGDDASVGLMDEMWSVDQEITVGFSSTSSADAAILELIAGILVVGSEIEASPYPAVGSWRAGSTRGQIINTLAALGDHETPWLANDGMFRMIRTVDPSTALPAITWDDTYPVIADTISETNDLIEAPNRFVVIGNGTDAAVSPDGVVGVYDVPPSAPHSIANRGFVLQRTIDMGVGTQAQAAAAARAIGMSQTIVEQVDATTPPDPRHDSYDVIRWNGSNWLETAWSMELIEGGDMTHTLRRGFAVV